MMSLFVMYFIRARLLDMARTQKPKRGRPAHTDDPPVLLSTSIPGSVDRILRELAVRSGRPRSELIADAVLAYARRFLELKSMKK